MIIERGFITSERIHRLVRSRRAPIVDEATHGIVEALGVDATIPRSGDGGATSELRPMGCSIVAR